MNVKLFESITTEESLLLIEAESEKWQGLHVDMDEAEQRKFVKDKAIDIKAILKRLDRSRIDLVRNYKLEVENEAEAIRLRLEAANLPFTALIDEWQAGRDKINKEKKAREDAKQLLIDHARDHEEAILIDFKETVERKERELAKAEYEQKLKDDAVKEAAEISKKQEALEKEKKRLVELKKLADTEHLKQFNNEAMNDLAMCTGIDLTLAKEIVKAIIKNKVSHITINY